MYRCFVVNLITLATLFWCGEALNARERISVDLGADDGRRDTGTPHWETWKVNEGGEAIRSFGDVRVTLRAVKTEGDGLRPFLTKTATSLDDIPVDSMFATTWSTTGTIAPPTAAHGRSALGSIRTTPEMATPIRMATVIRTFEDYLNWLASGSQ